MRNLPILAMLFSAPVIACGDDDDQPANPDANNGDTDAAADASGDVAITVTLANRPNAATTFGFIAAYRDGAGAWRLAPPPTNDTYELSITSPEWSFAWTCITASAATREVSVYQFTAAERTSLTIDVPTRCTDRATAVALGGTIANRPVAGGLRVGFGTSAGTATTGLSTTYSLQPLPATRDLFVGHAPTDINGNIVTDQATVKRALAVSGATTTADVDFATAQPTQSKTVTVATAAGETATVSTMLYSAGGTIFTMVNQTTGPNFTSTGLAAAMAQTGDVYNQQISVSAAAGAAIVQRWATAVADQTYAAPAALGSAMSTVPATTPYPMIQTTWTKYPNAIGYEWSARQSLSGAACGPAGGNCVVTWTSTVSPGVVGASPSIAMPDLSMLQGWDAKLQFQPGTNVSGSVRAVTSTKGASDFPVVDPAPSGTQRALVSSTWTVTP